ncbi:Bug family tripartite tricarboxylate transporter substrate binding protein [Pollutimonas sp. M17]|uniref:Bug family tripartite tricarboxylate transporter substrate binding protein n=1 Tax=Pollutimonas sp. M17 TaxID=2962065 RepID=UPI0021F4B022|nr:tripartite tricarboxylate transporter substrate binding protein [Pollutimonas sp. M17]UYO92514.1 tripartite tricarboxylate transporter substrate binding protein [Pollutimonas sp. M17]
MFKIARLSRPLLCALALAASPVLAQGSYPSQPIRMIVGFPPGGISDVVARAVASEASTVLGQTIVVENRPGAGTTIASDVVARSKADGYTLLFQDLTTHAINASLYKKLPYDTVKDFTPVAMVSSTPLLLVINSNSPVKTVQELNKRIQEKPGTYSYGSSGNGTIIHLASEMMNKEAKNDIVHIPYKGSAPLVTAIISGDIEYAFSSMPPAIAQVNAGKLRALAVSTPDRVDALPDVPTIREAGVPAAELTLYSGILGPAGMPDEIVSRLNEAFGKAVQSPKIIQTFSKLGAKPLSTPPAEIAKLLDSEISRYGKVVKETGITID